MSANEVTTVSVDAQTIARVQVEVTSDYEGDPAVSSPMALRVLIAVETGRIPRLGC